MTLKQLNEVIKKEIDNRLDLVKGSGYFYLKSNDNDLGVYLSKLSSTSIYVYRVNDLALDIWLSDIRDVLKSTD